MNYEVTKKELKDYTVYYKEGIIEDLSKIVEFILGSAKECMEANPNIKCIEPDYCYVCYLDNELKEKDIKVRYTQAVVEAGIETDTIKFEKLEKTPALSVLHEGPYDTIKGAYAYIMNYINENGYEITGCPREHYIDGMWNKENPKDWLTEIEVPVREK